MGSLLEGATMVAHGRPEDDEVRKSGGGSKDLPKDQKALYGYVAARLHRELRI